MMSIMTTMSFVAEILNKADPAYLDPGSGSFILQLLLAALVGGLFIIKTYWKKITDFFRKIFSRADQSKEE